MLARQIFLLLLLFIAGREADGQVIAKATELLGSWHSTSSNAAAVEITYFADHHYKLTLVGIVTGTMTGPWRLEGGQIVKKWSGGTVTIIGQKQRKADGSEQREKILKLEGGTLTVQERGADRPSKYERGLFPKP